MTLADDLTLFPRPPDLPKDVVPAALADWLRRIEGWLAGVQSARRQETPTPRRAPALVPDEGAVVVPWGPDWDAERTALGQTQGAQDADAHDAAVSEKGMEIRVVTDVKYDTTAHTLTVRFRTLKAPPGALGVTGEGDAVTITTAQECD